MRRAPAPPVAGGGCGAAAARRRLSAVVVPQHAEGGAGRLTVHHMPSEEPRRALGSISVFQQAEEMRQLAALSSGWGLGAPELDSPSGDGASGPAPQASAAASFATSVPIPEDEPVTRKATNLATAIVKLPISAARTALVPAERWN